MLKLNDMNITRLSLKLCCVNLDKKKKTHVGTSRLFSPVYAMYLRKIEFELIIKEQNKFRFSFLFNQNILFFLATANLYPP